jgi:hypothetical protein
LVCPKCGEQNPDQVEMECKICRSNKVTL